MVIDYKQNFILAESKIRSHISVSNFYILDVTLPGPGEAPSGGQIKTEASAICFILFAGSLALFLY